MHDENFETTEGLALLWELAAQPENIVFHSPDAESENMEYLEAEYRWPALYGNNGAIMVTVPRAGTFYPAVVIYDSEIPAHMPRSLGLVDFNQGQGSYEMSIDGEVVGRFFPRENDNRQRLYFLNRPVEFKGGEKIVLRTGPTGANLTEDIMLLRVKPPIRGRVFEVRNLEAGYIEREGRPEARLTWITTWPARCRIEYGAGDRAETVTEEEPAANHRVYLKHLHPGAEYRCRIVAPKPGGGSVESEEVTFTFSPPPPFEGGAKRADVPLRVENPHDFPVAACPISSGVPFAKGELGDVEHMRLLDSTGSAVPMQSLPLSRWEDGSVKWALVSFQADVAAAQTAVYTLEYGSETVPFVSDSPLRVKTTGDVITVTTGALEMVFDARQSGLPVRGALNGRPVLGQPMEARLVAEEGRPYDSNNPADLLEVEESGPVRAVIHSKGHHRSEDGESFFEYESRFVFYAGKPFCRVYHAWGNDREEDFSHFKSICLRVPLLKDATTRWALGLGQGKKASGEGDVDLCQLHHDSFQVEAEVPPTGPLHRADGWIDVSKGDMAICVAVRDFWQLYPKAFTIHDDHLDVGICPVVPAGTHESATERERESFYYYLLGGKYKIKHGFKKWHELMLSFHEEDVGSTRQAELAKVFRTPLIAVCPAERYCATRVFGAITPAGTGATDSFDALCEDSATRYVREREDGACYGMMHYGDLALKGRSSWLNGEYDLHHCFLLIFARTADPKWYFLAETVARHAIDVDTCHYGPHVGAVYAHQHGHMPGYFENQELDRMRKFIWGSPDHSWAEGFCDWYVVSGDRTGLQSAKAAGDYYARPILLNNYDYNNCRDCGWHIILSMGVYNLTLDPYYLNTARIVVERVLERQTPGPRGWHRELMLGHCHCTPRHRGACVYMLSILCRGLEMYYDATGDTRVAEAIVGAADQVIDEMWSEERDDFVATSCCTIMEKKNWSSSHFPQPVRLLLFAYLQTRRPRYLEIAQRVINRSSPSRRSGGGVDMVPWWATAYYHLDKISDKHSDGR